MDYPKLSLTALRLIAENGTECSVRRAIDREYDPITGAASGASWETQTVFAVFIPPSDGGGDTYEGANANRRKVTDVIIAAASLLWDIGPENQIQFGGSWFFLGKVAKLDPSDSTAVIITAGAYL